MQGFIGLSSLFTNPQLEYTHVALFRQQGYALTPPGITTGYPAMLHVHVTPPIPLCTLSAGSNVLSKWYGESEANVKDLFARAVKQQVCLCTDMRNSGFCPVIVEATAP